MQLINYKFFPALLISTKIADKTMLIETSKNVDNLMMQIIHTKLNVDTKYYNKNLNKVT